MRVKVPSKQEYEIYHAVETMGQSQRATAERFGIPVAKVREIVGEVRAFIVQHGSLQFLNVPPDKLELVALRVHVKRLMDFHRMMIRHIAKLEREAKALAKKAKPPKAAAKRAAATDRREPVDPPGGASSDGSEIQPVRTCVRRRRCRR